MKRVVVIGGGFAGLSAAVRLSGKNLSVTLLERRNQLGGRAYSFTERQTGDTVDNGQHLLMKCNRHTLEFLKQVGSSDRVQFQDRFAIEFCHRDRGRTRLSFPHLPSPLHLLLGLLRFKSIALSDIPRLAGVARHLDPLKVNRLSVEAWLERCRQTDRLRRSFWYPLSISALNQSPADAPANHLIRIFQEAFLKDRDGARLGYATAGLSKLYSGASRLIESRGGEVHLRRRVMRISRAGGRISIQLDSGERLDADACICSVPPSALFRLVPASLFSLRRDLTSFRPSPILSVNLWFEHPIMESDFVGLLGGRMHWVFNKSNLYRGRDRASNGHVAVVSSAADGLIDASDDDLVRISLEEIRTHLRVDPSNRLIHRLIVRERQATYALPPGAPRPGPRTEWPGLFLAGDWTDTGLPSTIESAVLSGRTAADAAEAFLFRR